jgi:hypothetical protein
VTVRCGVRIARIRYFHQVLRVDSMSTKLRGSTPAHRPLAPGTYGVPVSEAIMSNVLAAARDGLAAGDVPIGVYL